MRCAVLTYTIHHIFIDSSNVWHMPTLLLQLWLGTGHETLLLGWATFGLLLYWLTIITQLQPKTTVLCDLTRWHFIVNIKYKEPTELRPDHRSIATCVISRVYGKKPDSVSLPHCPSQPSLRLEDCYKAYRMTKLRYCRQTARHVVSVEILSVAAQL